MARFLLGGTGNATLTNRSTISGNVVALKSFTEGSTTYSGTGLATLNNYGVVSLLSPQAITGFSAVNNKSGGLLTGTGSFGAVTAESGSFIKPGNRSLADVGGVPQTGVMNMTSLAMQSGSTLEIRADGSGDNVNDNIVVAGAATLSTGAILSVLATPIAEALWKVDRSYRVITAQSRTGEFEVKTDLAFLDPIAVYGSNYVDLTFKRNTTTFQSFGETATEIVVGINIQRWQDSPDLSQQGQGLVAVMSALSVSDAKPALITLSGSGQSATAATVTGQFYGFTAQVVTEARTSPLAIGSAGPTAFAGSDMPMAYTVPEATGALGNPFGNLGPANPASYLSPVQTWRIWTSVYGASHVASPQASRGSPGVTWHDWSGAAGFESAVSDGIIAGVAVGGSSLAVLRRQARHHRREHRRHGQRLYLRHVR